VVEIVGISRPTIYRRIRNGEFPSGFYLFGHRGPIRWDPAEIKKWYRQQKTDARLDKMPVRPRRRMTAASKKKARVGRR
jgi:predicted DNA-binding transcriptional regulator AlpA